VVRIDKELCIGCGECVPYCTVGAIALTDQGYAEVNPDTCTDCYVCTRSEVCPVEAFSKEPLATFYDEFRHVLSDPTETTADTGVPGRGTEEAKTNDVTGRVRRGQVGFAIDMGRPGIGVRMRDVETVTKAVVAAGLELESPDISPLGKVLVDMKTGEMQQEAKDLYLLSVIVEGKCVESKARAVFEALRDVSDKIESVFSLGIVVRPEPNGEYPILSLIDELGIPQPYRAKVNLGLGRPIAEE